MKTTAIVSAFCLLLTISSCELVGPEDERADVPKLSAAEKARVAESNTFGINLLREWVASDDVRGNKIVSPLSVDIALGMTLNGADGETREEMARVMQLEQLSETEANEAFRMLIETLPELDPLVKLQPANAIWHHDSFAVETPFVDANQTFFDAEVRSLNFAAPQAADVINGWIEDKTNKRIRRVIDRIDPTTVMYLINALYFDAPWRVAFDPEKTNNAPFYLADGSATTVSMMQVNHTFATFRADDYRAVDIPYGDSLFSLTVLLPDEGSSPEALLKELDASEWNRILAGLRPAEVTLQLPRLEASAGTSLKEFLINLGMEKAFDPSRANLSRINRNGGLWVEDVVHKTVVRWNEQGTEAAAVTVVEIGRLSVDDSLIAVNRPFVFAIRERHTQSILFLGLIHQP